MRIALVSMGALAFAVWGAVVVVDPPTGPMFPEAEVSGDSFPLTLMAGGRRFTIARSPQRVVSLALFADEILLNLAPAERIAAVTRHAATPGASNVAEAASRVRGRIVNASDVEGILSLKPDLVIAGYYNRPEGTLLMLETGVPVVCLREPESIDDIVRNTRLLGRVLGVADRAEGIASRLEREAGDRRGGSRRVLWWNPSGYTLGQRTLATDLIERCGGVNISRFEYYSSVTIEHLLAADPDVLLIETWGGERPELPPELRARARFVAGMKVLTSAPDILEGLRQVREALSK